MLKLDSLECNTRSATSKEIKRNKLPQNMKQHFKTITDLSLFPDKLIGGISRRSLILHKHYILLFD